MVLPEGSTAQQQTDVRSIPVLITSISHNELRALVEGEVVTRTTDQAMELIRAFRTALASDAEMAANGLLDLSAEDVVERMATTALLRYRDVPQLTALALDTVLAFKTLQEIVGLIDAALGVKGVALDMEEVG